MISGDDDLGFGLHRTLEAYVILRVTAHAVQRVRHRDMFPIAGVFREDGKHFLIPPGELPHQRGPHLGNDLIADGEGVS